MLLGLYRTVTTISGKPDVLLFSFSEWISIEEI
jgi:hypothetical protein